MAKLIGISGKCGSGKSLFAKLLQKYDQEYAIVNFADKLKEVCSVITGLPVESFNSRRGKEMDLPTIWNNHKSPTPAYSPVEKLTVRNFMQLVGTDALRDNVHSNIWVNALFSEYLKMEAKWGNTPKWIVADVRFPNEADEIRARGGILIRLTREQSIQRPLCEQYHPSEVMLDNYSGFRYRIENNGSIIELEDHAREIINSLQ